MIPWTCWSVQDFVEDLYFVFIFTLYPYPVRKEKILRSALTAYACYKSYMWPVFKLGRIMEGILCNSWILKKSFYWSIVDLKCCVNFCYTAKWFSYICVCVCVLFHILFHYGLSQDSFLCYKVELCCLSILYIDMVVCIC